MENNVTVGIKGKNKDKNWQEGLDNHKEISEMLFQHIDEIVCSHFKKVTNNN